MPISMIFLIVSRFISLIFQIMNPSQFYPSPIGDYDTSLRDGL